MHLLHLRISVAGILALAGTVYAVLQSAKKTGLSAYITGRLAIAFNVAFAFLSTIVVAGTLDVNTVFTALVVALAAAGVHASLKTARNGYLSSSPQASQRAGASAATTAVALAAVLLVPFGASACANRAAVGVPTQMQAVQGAAAAADAMASGLKLAQDTLRALHQAGTVTDSEAAALNDWLVAVAEKNDTAISAIQAANASGSATGWQAATAAVAAAAAALPPSEFQIKNAQAKQAFITAVGVLESAAAAINSNGGTNGGTK